MNLSLYRLLSAGLALVTLLALPVMAQSPEKPSKDEAKKLDADGYYLEGLKLLMLDKLGPAEAALNQALEKSPDNPAIYYKLAELRMKAGDMDQALKASERTVDLDPRNVYYYQQLSTIQSRLGKHSDAAKTIKKLLKNISNRPDFYQNLANAQLSAGDWEDAIKSLNQLEKIQGKSIELTSRKQDIYQQQNKPNKVVEEGKALIEANPTEAMVYIMQAERLVDLNKEEDAIPYLRKSLELQPGLPFAHLLMSDIYLKKGDAEQAQSQLALAFQSPELELDDRIRILARYLRGFKDSKEQTFVIGLAKSTVEAFPNDPKGHAILGDFYNVADQKVEARASYLRSVALPGSTAQVWEQIVRLDVELQQEDSLLVHSERATEYFPNQAGFWFFAGRTNYAKKNYEKAIAQMEQAKRLTLSNKAMQTEIYATLGDLYHFTKAHEKSDESYEKALELEPKSDYVANNYAYFLSLRKDKLAKARKLTTRLVEDNPENPTYLDTHGWVLYMLKEYAEAQKFLEKAVSLDQKNGTLIEHLGDTYYQLGMKEKAVETWKKAKELGGNDLTPLLPKKIADKKLYE